MKLADSHLHLFRQGYAPRYGPAWANRRELELYESFRRVHHIESGLVVGFEGRREFLGNNNDIAKWAKTHSWISPLAFFPVAKTADVRRFQNWHRQGFAGIALYVMTLAEINRLNRWPQSVLEWLNEHRQIISFNAGPVALAHLKPFIEKLDQCTTLISHLGLPGRFTVIPGRRQVRKVLKPLQSLAKLTNVGVKLSGLYAISDPSHAYPHDSANPFIRQLYDDFGPRRLCWGSDFSPVLEHVSFSQTIDPLFQFGWPASELESIMHGNLMRIIGRKL